MVEEYVRRGGGAFGSRVRGLDFNFGFILFLEGSIGEVSVF